MEVYKKMSRASSLVSSNRTVEEEEDTDEPLDVDALMEMAPKMSVFPPQTSLPKTLPEDNSMDGSKYPSTHSPVDARSTTALPQAMDESDTKGREIAMNILNQLEIYKQTVSARLGENRAEDAHPTRAQDAGDTTGGSHVAASLLKEKALSGKAASKPSGNSDWGEGVSAPTRQRKNFATLLREQTEAQRKGNGVSHLSNKPLPNTRVAPRNGLVLRNDPSGRPDSTRRLVPINFMNQEEQLPASRRPKKR
ncbi:hypothetical protein AGDE_14259 [Angomonas deanei]|uniref:Uncharacterized protein n=1 Tax=Angomonas deanei TaxID=59799 RepID=A0A7G2C6A1_9TRYP|nr:hypothetical protein AGDE_14259 [Angomonas deanei]CAD2214317.1 hypothetical protein, conserved [Angomonas deanei]|eukprot:EPY21161.1 hypothetical protein AGDE_14259 [Angomonas deanei]